MNIAEACDKKRQLQKDMLALIRKYEAETGTTIKGVYSDSGYMIGQNGLTVISVMVEVSI
jgi:hypothetical protein